MAQRILTCGYKDCKDLHHWGPGFRSTYIIHYIISGKGYFTRGGNTYLVTAGESFFIKPFEEVSYRPDETDPWEYTWIDFSGERYLSLLRKTSFFENDSVVGKIEQEKILPLFERINDIFSYSDSHYTCEGIAMAILGVYADSFPAIANASKEKIYFNSACSIIHGSFHRPSFGIETVCQELSISRVTLHRCFKKCCGVSPGAYLLNYRIEQAKELLLRGASVKSTALSCGFSDPLYFSKAFKTATDKSPKEYRNI